MTQTFNLSQLVDELLTRPVSSTCPDHVYTTHPGFIADISVPNIGLADHLPVFITSEENTQKKQRDTFHSTIEYRDLKKLNTNELLKELQCTPWDEAFVFGDKNDVLSSIETMLNDVLEQYLPLKSKRVKKPNPEPVWMTKEILHSKKTRDNLLKKARNSNLHEDWAQYTHAKVFFGEKIDENKGNPKGIWKALKSLSGTSNPRVRINEIVTENGIVSDEASNANELNIKYFANFLEQICKANITDVH